MDRCRVCLRLQTVSATRSPFMRNESIRAWRSRSAGIGLDTLAGNSLYVSPSRSRPATFFLNSAPLLEEKGVPPPDSHCSLIERTQEASIGLDRGPLSPPTITQAMPRRFSRPTSSIRGSTDRNLTFAGVDRRCLMRGRLVVHFVFNADAPPDVLLEVLPSSVWSSTMTRAGLLFLVRI